MKQYKNRMILFAILSVVMLCCPGCGKETEHKAQEDNGKKGTTLEENTAKEEILPKTTHGAIKRMYDGTKSIKTPEGTMWTPPVGSYEDTEGYIYDEEGCVIGYTGPIRYNPNAKG